MIFPTSLELVKQAENQGYAVPSFCVWNAEMITTVLSVCRELYSPVILMNGPAELALLDPREMAAVAASLVESGSVPAALHLDHGSSIGMVRECVDAGYSSVMLDLSALPIEENVTGMRETVAIARPRGITTEGELGKVGREDDMFAESDGESVFTDPSRAEGFVRETDVDLLAVSFGNVHGAYSGTPNLDFVLLEELQAAAGVPLVLHGGSGIPRADLERAISLGIAKVNIASDLVNGVRNSLLGQWRDGRNLWTPVAMAEAVKSIIPVVERWIKALGAHNRV